MVFIHLWREIRIQIAPKNSTAILENCMTVMATIWGTFHNIFGSCLLWWSKKTGNWHKSYITWDCMVESTGANIDTTLRQSIQYEFNFLQRLWISQKRDIFVLKFNKKLQDAVWRHKHLHWHHISQNFIKRHFCLSVHQGLHGSVCWFKYQCQVVTVHSILSASI
jgi:hypothetical protein